MLHLLSSSSSPQRPPPSALHVQPEPSLYPIKKREEREVVPLRRLSRRADEESNALLGAPSSEVPPYRIRLVVLDGKADEVELLEEGKRVLTEGMKRVKGERRSIPLPVRLPDEAQYSEGGGESRRIEVGNVEVEKLNWECGDTRVERSDRRDGFELRDDREVLLVELDSAEVTRAKEGNGGEAVITQDEGAEVGKDVGIEEPMGREDFEIVKSYASEKGEGRENRGGREKEYGVFDLQCEHCRRLATMSTRRPQR